MRRPVSIRRNHRTRDESRHREPHWPNRVPRVLSSRARLAVRKSFQTLETMENTINSTEEREIFLGTPRYQFRQLAVTRSRLFRFFLVFAGSIDGSIDSFEFSTPPVHFPIVSNRSNHRRLCVPAIRRTTEHETRRSRQITRSRAFRARITTVAIVEQRP